MISTSRRVDCIIGSVEYPGSGYFFFFFVTFVRGFFFNRLYCDGVRYAPFSLTSDCASPVAILGVKRRLTSSFMYCTY